MRARLPIIFLAALTSPACFEGDHGERALPIAVIDTTSSEIVERWDVPLLTVDVALDDATGALWVVTASQSELKPPRVWEIQPGKGGKRRYTFSKDFWGIGKILYLDYGVIALDPIARRGAFTSPRSEQLILIDLDSGEPVRRIDSDYLGHGTAFDTARGIGYATASSVPYAFRTSDGELLADYFCLESLGGPPIVVSSSGLVYAPIGGSFAQDSVCIFDPEVGASSEEMSCNNAYCYPAGTVVSPDGTRLFIAMPRMPRIHVIDLENWTETWLDDWSGPHGLEISPDGQRLYVSKIACNRISVLDATTPIPTHLFDIELDGEPMGMDLSADGSRLYVSQVDPEGVLGHGLEFLEDEGNHFTPECPPLVPPP